MVSIKVAAKMSSCSLDKLELHCTWSAGNGKSIKDALTVEPSEHDKTKSDIDDLVSLETCIKLFSPNSSSCTPELKFNVTPDLRICAIKIISEARIIELYGQGGEYLYTSHSDFVDDFEGMAVYSTMVRLRIPSSECSIGFKKFKHQDNFWLYGIGVYVKDVATDGLNEEEIQNLKHNSTENAASQIDLNSVSDRLQQSGRNLTENAGQCMKLLQTFQKLGRHDTGEVNDSDGCVSKKNMATETSRKFCDLLLNMPPLHDRSKTPKTSSEEFNRLSLSDSASSDIHRLISEQFQKLEEKLMGKMEERLNIIEGKIDFLTSLLQKVNQNVETDQEVEK